MPRTKYSIGYKHGEGFEEYSVSIEVFSDQSDVHSSEMATLLLDTIEAVESRLDEVREVIPVEDDGGSIEGNVAGSEPAVADEYQDLVGSPGQNREPQISEDPAQQQPSIQAELAAELEAEDSDVG